jgi:hypothetical protein
MDEPRFRRAYRQSVGAVGVDLQIYWRIHTLLWAAELAVPLPGAFVECGTARGMMASAICEHLGWDGRRFLLVDTFQPPPPGPHQEALRLVYAEGVEPVRERFARWPGVELLEGRIPEVLAGVEVEHVAFLHVDLNGAAAETAAVEYFWPRLVPGGVLVYDDYGHFEYAESHAAADALAERLGYSILELPTGQGLVVKSPAPAR